MSRLPEKFCFCGQDVHNYVVKVQIKLVRSNIYDSYKTETGLFLTSLIEWKSILLQFQLKNSKYFKPKLKTFSA